ncbi:MAG: cytotoxic translational repressor of toxin-antitoxin stability system [Trichloromonas sp.]|jgi:mRNA-degrading endonuclease RelE of RelBE toxin-antitoxin system|nr:cytotoxic translational repressor of toxin-antitoxin stability system [Trichloromonas sp.]
MTWNVHFSRQAQKQTDRLPVKIQGILQALVIDLEENGPVRGNWANYGKLTSLRHHCHLKKGKPCYVAVWEVADKEMKLIEVIYAGTHEKAPY